MPVKPWQWQPQPPPRLATRVYQHHPLPQDRAGVGRSGRDHVSCGAIWPRPPRVSVTPRALALMLGCNPPGTLGTLALALACIVGGVGLTGLPVLTCALAAEGVLGVRVPPTCHATCHAQMPERRLSAQPRLQGLFMGEPSITCTCTS